jgi:hypothetical protein
MILGFITVHVYTNLHLNPFPIIHFFKNSFSPYLGTSTCLSLLSQVKPTKLFSFQAFIPLLHPILVQPVELHLRLQKKLCKKKINWSKNCASWIVFNYPITFYTKKHTTFFCCKFCQALAALPFCNSRFSDLI